MSAEQLSQILWRERELLETLHFKLEVERLVLMSGQTQWLARAAREAESLLDLLRETEMLRAVAADELASQVGLEHNSSLRALADALDEPWHTIFVDHRDAFSTLIVELDRLAAVDRELLTNGLRSTREVLLSLNDQGSAYGSDGAVRAVVAEPAGLLDRSM